MDNTTLLYIIDDLLDWLEGEHYGMRETAEEYLLETYCFQLPADIE